MIRLEVKEYCQDCMDFSPDVSRSRKEFNDPKGGFTITDTIVQCEYRNRCRNMMRYLEQQTKGE